MRQRGEGDTQGNVRSGFGFGFDAHVIHIHRIQHPVVDENGVASCELQIANGAASEHGAIS